MLSPQKQPGIGWPIPGYFRANVSKQRSDSARPLHPEQPDAIDAFGRLHTDGFGYLDEDSNLPISGRKKDIIIRHGNNISTRKIAKSIYGLSDVSQAAVVGAPHEKCK